MAFDKEHSKFWSNYRDNNITKMRNKLSLYDNDPEQTKRLNENLCKSCYYVHNDGWGGQAITTKKCEDCGKEMTFASTNVDNFCNVCALKNNVCKHCGGKMD